MKERRAGRPAAAPELPPLFPENRKALDIFRACLSQMNVAGMGGVIGLRYESLPFLFEVYGVPRRRWRDVFEKVQILERFWIQKVNAKK